ncbi:MAG: hypothetical protein AAFU79_18330 [Myxococcota bacterium]
MGLFDFLRRRSNHAPAHRTWTRAKDVAVFASPEEGPRLERALSKEGIQARVFVGAEGRAVEILTRFLPSVILIRADLAEADAVLAATADVPGLAEVPVILASASDDLDLREILGPRVGGVASAPDPDALVAACRSLAPELG